MPSLHKRRSAWLALMPALLITSSYAAQAPGPQDPLSLDQTIQALKDEVLQFNRDAQRAEEAVAFPAHSRVSVYIGIKTPGLMLKTVSISIDGGQPVVYDYSSEGAEALLRSRGLQLLGRFNAPAGGHRLHAEFTAGYLDDANAAVVTDATDLSFDKDDTHATELKLAVVVPSRGAKPSLTLW